ncbi:hypothetical protein ACEPAH_8396 [Sanghuangporus vaninii]
MKMPFMKPRPQPLDSPAYRRNPLKYSPFRYGARPEGFTDMLIRDGPDVVISVWPWEAVFDPYLSADIKREKCNRAINGWDNRTYLAEGKPNLKRQKARYGDSRWTHLKRCNLCEADNVCKDRPGVYRCENSYYGGRCRGQFEVTQRDAVRVQHMPLEERVPFNSLSDRYDHDALRAKNMARTRAMKYGARA